MWYHGDLYIYATRTRSLMINLSFETMERMETSGNQPGHVGDDFNLLSQDLFINESNFEQFIDLIRGETNDPIVEFCHNYDCEHVSGCLDHTQFGPTPGDQDQDPLFGCNNLSSGLNALPAVDVGEEENDNDIGEEYSSATTTTTTRLTKRKGGDRSRTLVSERKRRGRMKEKLYALRALVPNITKMDKASIVGDAVEYLQELQIQARKLRAEIAGLESSLTEGDRHQQGIVENRKNIQFISPNHTICKHIMQMDMIQVEERGFYVRVECNRGQGVASSLYKAIESLTRFNVQSSNLATLSERFILTFTIKIADSRDPFINPRSQKGSRRQRSREGSGCQRTSPELSH
ncbi:hypothetical protein CsSME_00040632 [Camellia sinensis var. sinensis]